MDKTKWKVVVFIAITISIITGGIIILKRK